MTGYSPSLQSVNSNPEKQMAATPMKKANSTIMPRRAMTTMLLLIAKKASLRDSVKCRVSVSTKVSSGEQKHVQHVGSPKINEKGENEKRSREHGQNESLPREQYTSTTRQNVEAELRVPVVTRVETVGTQDAVSEEDDDE
jgi:hypothetical protein